MEQTAVASKPYVLAGILDDMIDPPDKLAIAVISIVSKDSGRLIKLVETAVLGAKPKTTTPVSGDARNISSADAIGVSRVVKIAGKAFVYRVEFIYPGVGRDPQIAVIVFRQIFNEVRA